MSFYILELSLQNDLTRRDYFIYNNKEKIREKIYDYLISPGCYEVVWCGAKINLYIYENFKPKFMIDLHQYIIFELDEYPQIYFDPNNLPIIIDKEENIVPTDDANFHEYFCTKICNNGNDDIIDVKINMNSIPLLNGRLLEKQEIFYLDLFPGIKFHYGYNDLEFGNDISDSESDMHTEAFDSIDSDYSDVASFDEMDTKIL